MVKARPMSMQKRQTLMRATCSRMSMTVSRGRVSFLSSWPILPVKRPKARGMRATKTLSGVMTLPNWRRDME
jgi:hypothetical protein